MFDAAARAISAMVSCADRAEGRLLPPLQNIREVSFAVALATAKQARDDGLGVRESDERLAKLIREAMWEPRYYPYRLGRPDHSW